MKNKLVLIALIGSSLLLSACSRTSPNTNDSSNKTYTMAEIEKHDSKSDCWLAVEGNVYDVTDFIDTHPGGDDILKGCGKDATDLFKSEKEHNEKGAQDALAGLKIGVVSK